MKPHTFPRYLRLHPVRLALIAMSLFAMPGLALAEDDDSKEDETSEEVLDLICPENYIELGGMGVNGSPKFGEYSGLNKSGPYALGSFGIHRGDGYCQRGGTFRFDAYGRNLGTTSRELGMSVGEQGKWRFNLDYDQLRHYTATGYRSPFQGNAGDNVFTLPSNFGTYFTVPGQPQLTESQYRMLQPKDVYNQRKNITLGATYAVNDSWGVKLDWKHLNMDGGKLIGGYSDQIGLASGLPGSGGTGAGTPLFGSGLALLLNPNKSTTDTFGASLNWTGKNAYASVEYFGSLYQDQYRGFSWSNGYYGGTATGPLPLPAAVGGVYPTTTLSTPPSNQFHQLKFAGGYIMSSATKLTGGFSFGISQQNEGFDGAYGDTLYRGPSALVMPTSKSLNGEVLVWNANARLTHKFTSKLNADIGFKYNERVNNTPSFTYQYLRPYDNQVPNYPAGQAGVPNYVTNIPMSYRKMNFDANLNYRIDQNQRVGLGYEYDRINRWCKNGPFDSPRANNPLTATNGVNNSNLALLGNYTSVGCVASDGNYENKIKLDYKLAVLDNVNFRAGYAYGDRKADFTHLYYSPLQVSAFGGDSNAIDTYGFRPFYNTSRREHLVKAGVSWDVTNRVTVDLDGRYSRDSYYDSDLGMTDGNSGSVNLDVQFNATENASYGTYFSYARNESNLKLGLQNSVAPADGGALNRLKPSISTWGNTLTDSDIAIGIYGKQKMLNGKFVLTEDISYNFGKSNYNTTLITNVAGTGGNTGNTGSPGDITSRMFQLNVAGTYALTKASSVTAGFLYQRLISNDYLYNVYGNNIYAVGTMMPNDMRSPTYSNKMVYVSYRYSFQ